MRTISTRNRIRCTGVRLPHRAVYNRLNWQWNRFPYGETERMCVFKTSLTFVDSVAEIWAPLLHDKPRCLMVVSKAVTKDPERLINALHENKASYPRLSPPPTPTHPTFFCKNEKKNKFIFENCNESIKSF